MVSQDTRIGIDLGGTKIEIIVLDKKGSEVFRHRIDTPKSYQGSLDALCSLVQMADEKTKTRSPVGIGIPGTISPATGLVKNANSTWLIGHPLDKDLARILNRPVRLMNDANCFTLSEATDGAGRNAEIVFGVILGTGVGGGIAIGKKIVSGAQMIAGEWGHNPLPYPTDDERPGRKCYCERYGCVETFLSGPGMEHDFEYATGVSLGSRKISSLAQDGDEQAVAALNRYVDRLGRALASVINVLDPHVIVLGGGMSNIPDLATKAERAITPYVFSDTVVTKVFQNKHGDSSGVRGAAWL